jgi:hypothetical protein
MDGNGFGAIAEGPTGVGAADVVYDSWVDGRDGVDNEHVLLNYSRRVAQTGQLRTRWRAEPTTAATTRPSRCRRTGPTRRGVLRLRRRRTKCVAHTNHAGRWFADSWSRRGADSACEEHRNEIVR